MSRSSHVVTYHISIPFCSILTAIAIYMFIRLSMHAIPEVLRDKTKSSPMITILMLLCAACSCLGCLIETLRFCTSMERDNLLHNPYINVLDDLFHFAGQFLFYVVALMRIKIIFAVTKIAITSTTMAIYLTLICIQLAMNLWHVYNVIWAFFFLNQNNEDTLHNVIVIPVMLMSFFSFILNASLIALFVYKLQRFILCEMIESKDKNIAEGTKKAVDALFKCSIIFGIAIFTNELFYVSLIVNKYTESHGWYVFLARAIENFSNITALYLTYKANERLYYKLCNVLDDCARKVSPIASAVDAKMLEVTVSNKFGSTSPTEPSAISVPSPREEVDDSSHD